VRRLVLDDTCTCNELAPAFTTHCRTLRELKAQRQHVLNELNTRPRYRDLVHRLINVATR